MTDGERFPETCLKLVAERISKVSTGGGGGGVTGGPRREAMPCHPQRPWPAGGRLPPRWAHTQIASAVGSIGKSSIAGDAGLYR